MPFDQAVWKEEELELVVVADFEVVERVIGSFGRTVVLTLAEELLVEVRVIGSSGKTVVVTEAEEIVEVGLLQILGSAAVQMVVFAVGETPKVV